MLVSMQQGMLVIFDRQLEVALTGQLSGILRESHIAIVTRIVRVEGRVAALAFQGMSEKDRAIIQKLI